MALTEDKVDFVERLIGAMELLLSAKSEFEALNSLYSGQTVNFLANLTQQDLAEMTAYVGVQKASLTEGAYLCGLINTEMDTRVEHVAALTRRSRRR